MTGFALPPMVVFWPALIILLAVFVYGFLVFPITMIYHGARNTTLSPGWKTAWLVFLALMFPFASYLYALRHAPLYRYKIAATIMLTLIFVAVMHKYGTYEWLMTRLSMTPSP